MLDRAVLTGRVDRLKDDQQRAVGLGEEAVLQIQQRRFRVSQRRGTVVFSELFVVAAGIEVLGQLHLGPRLYPGSLR